MTVWSGSTPKSRKVLDGKTFVRYANNKIFAVGAYSNGLHILDLQLTTLKVVQHKFKGAIFTMETSGDIIAFGEGGGNVTVFNNNGEIVLVSYI